MEKKFGEVLKALREKAGISQNQLGEKTGLTGSYFCMLESGKKPAPSDDVVKKIAKELETDEKELLEIAHLDRAPRDIKSKVRNVDFHKRMNRYLVDDFLPFSVLNLNIAKVDVRRVVEGLEKDPRRRAAYAKTIERVRNGRNFEEAKKLMRAHLESLPESQREDFVKLLAQLCRAKPDSRKPDKNQD
jgi:transcriptional regulator with XRE-family HTH domain